MHEEELSELGLSANEARIYLALLALGPATPSSISGRTGLHRAYVYDALSRMEEKGVASEVEMEGKKHFHAAAPKRLVELARLRLERLEKAMPFYEKLAGQAGGETAVELFKGRGATKMLFRDAIATLRRGDEFLGIGIDEEEFSREEPVLLRQYLNHISRNGIRERVIIREGSMTMPEAKTTKYRCLDGKYLGNASTWIYGSKVASIVIGEPNYAVLIENRRLAQTYRNQFALLWEKARPVRRASRPLERPGAGQGKRV